MDRLPPAFDEIDKTLDPRLRVRGGGVRFMDEPAQPIGAVSNYVNVSKVHGSKTYSSTELGTR